MDASWLAHQDQRNAHLQQQRKQQEQEQEQRQQQQQQLCHTSSDMCCDSSMQDDGGMQFEEDSDIHVYRNTNQNFNTLNFVTPVEDHRRLQSSLKRGRREEEEEGEESVLRDRQRFKVMMNFPGQHQEHQQVQQRQQHNMQQHAEYHHHQYPGPGFLGQPQGTGGFFHQHEAQAHSMSMEM